MNSCLTTVPDYKKRIHNNQNRAEPHRNQGKVKKYFRLTEKTSVSNISIRFVKYFRMFFQGKFEQLLLSVIVWVRSLTQSPQILLRIDPKKKKNDDQRKLI